MIIDAYLQILLEQSASDLILTAGAPPTMRKDGALVPIGPDPLRPEQIDSGILWGEEHTDFNLLTLLPGDRTPLEFRFTPEGGSSWTIDDVFVDPWRGT